MTEPSRYSESNEGAGAGADRESGSGTPAG